MAKRKVDPDRIDLETVVATPMREKGEREGGQRYWRARTTGPDRQVVWTGWATREEARAAVEAAMRKAPTTSRPSGPEVVRTVADLVRKWTGHQEQRHKAGEIAERSLVNYRQAGRYWRDAIGDVLIGALSRPMVEDQLTAWQAQGVSPRTCKLALDVLAAAVKWGAARGHCPALDLSRMHTLKVRDDEFVNVSYTPTRAEATRVIVSIPPGRERDVVSLLAITGARVGEVAALHVRDVDLGRGVLLLSGRDERRQRRGKVVTRRWPIEGALVALLQRLVAGRSPDDPLVPGLPMDCSDMVRRALDEACEAAEVERFSSHGLRRMVAMELLEVSGSNAKAVSQLTGHSVHELLTHYVRPRETELRDLVSRARVSRITPVAEDNVVRFRAAVHGAPDPGTGGEDDV